MKKLILALTMVWGGLLAFSDEKEAITIATFDVSGSCISFGQNNRVKWNPEVIVEIAKTGTDTYEDFNEIQDKLKPSFSKSSDTLGFSIYHIFPKKHIDNNCSCKSCRRANKTSKRAVIGGSLGAFMFKNKNDELGGGYFNVDFMFGSSWIKNNNIKILTLGVVGIGTTKVGTYSSVEPEIGMEIDLAFNPFNAKNIQTGKMLGFWIVAGIRGLVGIDFIQTTAKDNFWLLTATLKPKISAGVSF